MKIALFNSAIPFVRGGSELLADDLKSQLETRGYEVKLFRLPFIEDFEVGIFLNALSAQLLNFDDYDLLISFKWPAYLAVHKCKNLWLFHQLRQVYDLFGKSHGLENNDLGNAIKEMVVQVDTLALNDANKIFAISNSAKRLEKYNNIKASVMHAPLLNSEKYHKTSYGDYFYCASRIDTMKRQILAVEAMRYTKSDVKLILDGVCGDEAFLNDIYSIINDHKLNKKITINANFVPEETKINRYANCLASIYLPVDEDSPGFVTFEAFYSHKTLITAADSGGVVDFVKNGENSFVVEPSPQAIAEKMDYLYEQKHIAKQMGKKAYEFIVEQNVNWDDTIRRLLA